MTIKHFVAPLDASKLEISELVNPKSVPDANSPEIKSLKAATDRMIVASWTSENGWGAPKVVPHSPISLMPSASALQYATQCFEGMKVFRGYDGRLRLFRPLYNCERMLSSATRISLPSFDPKELLKLIHEICALEAPKWLPKDQPGSALYIRPTFIGSDSSLGFKVPDEAQLYIFLMYWLPPKPVVVNGSVTQAGTRLLASPESAVRAWPGGSGAAKVGGNYGSALVQHALAKKEGYNQVLWLYGPDRQITEAGSTNIFFMLKTDSGALEMVTSPLDEDNLILAGNTRRSIIDLSRAMFDAPVAEKELLCKVIERRITMGQVEEAYHQKKLVGVFVVGTAFWIQEVSEISFNGETIKVEMGATPHVALLRERMSDIIFGKEESDWADIVDEA
ncbi:Branched-chain-amino-acid aminotransferase mitochondrial [Fusarium albosuccineum]|uniref:Branched-chain-amino-acid aminotransferase mitochondrial n=1 Tax=Fusarium albosuccineum TaxID=1237068 RepID=A0A8H4L1H9_9HYPO|nr:Branched-chain-amino-acid aminotransferase mitochondrial [Fusarium albosuccineum]